MKTGKSKRTKPKLAKTVPGYNHWGD